MKILVWLFDGRAVVEHNSELEKEVREGERRVALYRRRLEKLQADYHNLIGITADLVDTLEATLQGKPVAACFLCPLSTV